MNLLQAIDDLARNFLIDDRTPVELVVALGRLRKAATDVSALLPQVAPFDLAKALAGAPIVTRDGRAVEIFRFDRGPCEILVHPVGGRDTWIYDRHGRSLSRIPSRDLFMKVAP